MSGSRRGWVASGTLATIVAGGYLGLMPLLSSAVTAPEWPAALEELAPTKLVVAQVGVAAPQVGRTAPATAATAGTLVRVSPTSGDKVKAPKPAVKTEARTVERRAVARYTPPRADVAVTPVQAAPAPTRPAPQASRPAVKPKPKPAPKPEAEIVSVDVPSLAGGDSSPAADVDPGTAGSGG